MLIKGIMTDARGRITHFSVDAESNRQSYPSPGVDLTAQGRLLWAIQELIAVYEEGDL